MYPCANTLHHHACSIAASVSFRTSWRSRSHRRYSISDGSTRPAPYGLNEPIKLSIVYGHHDGHRFPARSLTSLVSYRLDLSASRALSLSSPFPAPFLSHFYYCSRIFLRTQCFLTFFTSLHFVHSGS